MRKPITVISKTKTTPKWLHQCRGFFTPRTLSLFAGSVGTAAIASFVISPGPSTSLIDNFLRQDKPTHHQRLSTALHEIETAPVLIEASKNSSTDADGNQPTSTLINQCQLARLAAEDRIQQARTHSEEVIASLNSIRKIKGEEKSLAERIAFIKAEIPSNCR